MSEARESTRGRRRGDVDGVGPKTAWGWGLPIFAVDAKAVEADVWKCVPKRTGLLLCRGGWQKHVLPM